MQKMYTVVWARTPTSYNSNQLLNTDDPSKILVIKEPEIFNGKYIKVKFSEEFLRKNSLPDEGYDIEEIYTLEDGSKVNHFKNNHLAFYNFVSQELKDLLMPKTVQTTKVVCDLTKILTNNEGDNQGEFLPGATRSEVGHILMQSIVGQYDVPESVPEWKWVENNATYRHCSNGTKGIWEFIINIDYVLNNPTAEIPEKLKPVLMSASKLNLAYLIFNQGT